MAQKSSRQPQTAVPPSNPATPVAAGPARSGLLERAAIATGFPLASLLDVAVHDDRLVIVTIDGRKHHLAALPDLTAEQPTRDDMAGVAQ